MKEMTMQEISDLATNGVPVGTHVSTHWMNDAERNLYHTASGSQRLEYPLTVGMTPDLHPILMSARFDEKTLRTVNGCVYVYALLQLAIDFDLGFTNISPRLRMECTRMIIVADMVPSNAQYAFRMADWGVALLNDIGKENGFTFQNVAGTMRFQPYKN